MMNQLRKPTIWQLIAVISLLGLFFTAPAPVQAQSGTPWEVLAEINGYRAANGLPPLVENQALNLAAQNHVNWMAATGEYGHIGEGGSTYTDRALAAGYGDGSNIRVTENWARGPKLTPSGAVYDMWAPSAVHNSQMLTTTYNEFGAGVALDQDGMTVYVVVFGLVIGGDVPALPKQPTASTSGPTSTPAPLVQPITTADPNPDGSIVHVVKYGQTLSAIAKAYEIPLTELLSQNYLTEESVIYPEEELLIAPAKAETEKPTSTPPEKEAASTPTAQPSLTPTKRAEPNPTRQIEPYEKTETPETTDNLRWQLFEGDNHWLGIGLVSVSLGGIALLFITESRLK